MLEHLEISNYALIENLSVDLGEGFTVITGETGAGKSIILGALGLLMGEKADSNAVRRGAREIAINAVVSVPEGHEILPWLAERGAEPEDGELVIRRTVKSESGRSSIYVQNRLFTRQELCYLADSLIDMHGQSEHQSLLHADRQRKILDSYAQNQGLLEKCSSCHKSVVATKARMEELAQRIEEGARQEDYLRFALSEIDEAAIREGEDEQLKEKISLLSHFESICENLQSCCEKLSEAKNALHDASTLCFKASKSDSTLGDFVARMESARIEADDVALSLRGYLEGVDYSETAVNMLQDRLAQLQKLKRKYGPSLENVAAFAENARRTLELSENSEEELDACRKELAKAEKGLEKACEELTKSRRKAAAELGSKIGDVLRTLGMPSALFDICISEKDEATSNGKDNVDFTICANQGEKVCLLKDVASGGELSRVMLSIKAVLADNDSVQTQVFDEVDSGIGGSVALSLADCMQTLSKRKQVIAVTHLASIASKADSQLVVSKTVSEGRTYSSLRVVQGEERVHEIARMLSGDDQSVTLEHARNMLKGRN